MKDNGPSARPAPYSILPLGVITCHIARAGGTLRRLCDSDSPFGQPSHSFSPADVKD